MGSRKEGAAAEASRSSSKRLRGSRKPPHDNRPCNTPVELTVWKRPMEAPRIGASRTSNQLTTRRDIRHLAFAWRVLRRSRGDRSLVVRGDTWSGYRVPTTSAE